MKLISLTQGQFAKVDDDDFDKFSEVKWQAAYRPRPKVFYAVRGSGSCKRKIFLHREIMGDPVGMVVDHINHDTLDNQKKNLRVCTHAQNMSNRKVNKNSKSGARGVSWNKENGRWISQIRVNYKRIHLGSFRDKESAIVAYADANKKYFGEFGGNL